VLFDSWFLLVRIRSNILHKFPKINICKLDVVVIVSIVDFNGVHSAESWSCLTPNVLEDHSHRRALNAPLEIPLLFRVAEGAGLETSVTNRYLGKELSAALALTNLTGVVLASCPDATAGQARRCSIPPQNRSGKGHRRKPVGAGRVGASSLQVSHMHKVGIRILRRCSIHLCTLALCHQMCSFPSQAAISPLSGTAGKP
jgi:hypothetical protein